MLLLPNFATRDTAFLCVP